MRLIQNEVPYENITQRLESEDGKYYMGIYPVMFGFRVRAGLLSEGYVDLDWCCGSNEAVILIVYNCLRKYLEEYDSDGNPFDKLPSSSDIKPLQNDENFIIQVSKLIPEFEIIKTMFK